jgi:hypothetical protein
MSEKRLSSFSVTFYILVLMSQALKLGKNGKTRPLTRSSPNSVFQKDRLLHSP